MRKVNAIIERANDGSYSIYSDAADLGYLITATGLTVEEAKKEFNECYDEMREYYKEERKPFEEVEMIFTYDLASFLSYYSNTITLAGLARLTGINPQQLSHYATGRRRPSQKTTRKILDAIHAFGHDLCTVQLA